MMSTSVYIISLTSEKERRKNIANQLNKLNLEFKFYDAVDFRTTDEFIAKPHIIHDIEFQKPSRPLTRSEIGCTLSHINLISSLNNLNLSSNFLILEDDAIIDSRLIGLLNSDKLKDFDWDIIILGYSKLDKKLSKQFYIKEPINKIKEINNIKIGVVWNEWTCGTVGYLINNKSINKFKALNPSSMADDWNYIKNKLNLKIFHIRPLLVFEDFTGFSSSIEGERKQFLKKSTYILEPIRIMRGILRRLFFLLKNPNQRK